MDTRMESAWKTSEEDPYVTSAMTQPVLIEYLVQVQKSITRGLPVENIIRIQVAGLTKSR